jgi:methionyl-tRNA synthetase
MENFYITTPMYYVSGKPHIGNAYCTILADIIARWNRLAGKKVLFVTGTDEHGGKTEKAAKEQGKSNKEFTDEITAEYMEAWKALNISYDRFVRTTDKQHEDAVRTFVGLVWDNEDIYKSKYEGWYCLPDETFIPEMDLKDGKCPECGREVQKLSEDAYFFSLARYRDDLLRIFDENPEFVQPQSRANEIRNLINGGLKDIDITRKSVTWGIKFPYDEEQTIYVWFDALISYISALGWPDEGDFVEFWPANVQLVGKEITRFHATLWPAMLLSAGIDIPQKILSHGWWTADGKKISKSLGNAVDPIDLAEKYSADALRYFLVREKPILEDGDFSVKALVARINGELMADLSNLAARVLTIAEKFNGKINGSPELEKFLDLEKIFDCFQRYDLTAALNEIWVFVKQVNKYINDKEPWKLKGEELSRVLYNALESLRIISILLYPFMPSTSEKLMAQLGVELGTLENCRFSGFNGKVKRGANLFDKTEIKT